LSRAQAQHVTLSIVWDKYTAGNPEGYRYSRFCGLCRAWEGKLSVTMRQTHTGGDKLFVDYAGDTVSSTGCPARCAQRKSSSR
jgi:transposase